jgi:hypothetical protein
MEAALLAFVSDMEGSNKIEDGDRKSCLSHLQRLHHPMKLGFPPAGKPYSKKSARSC